MQLRLLRTEGHGLLAEVEVNGTLLGVMDDFSYMPSRVDPTTWSPAFSYLTLAEPSWEERFGGNPQREQRLERTGPWSYNGYGRIVAIQPVVIDFGLLTLEAGFWTRDTRCVGEYVREQIGRLDLSFYPPEPHAELPVVADVRPSTQVD